MKLQLLTIGKSKTPFLRDGQAEYLKRLRRYTAIELAEMVAKDIPPDANSAKIAQILNEEAEKILKRIPGGATLIALAIAGKEFSSEDFSAQIQKWQNQGTKEIIFVIGGAHGLHKRVLEKAAFSLSLSRFTIAHELAGVVFLEQLYRAYTILNREPYHK